MSLNDITKLVIESVKEIGADQENDALINASEETSLFGTNLDSMGTVFLVTDLEERISDELGVELALADERAMSQKTSPFRDVKKLSNYVLMLVEEENKQ